MYVANDITNKSLGGGGGGVVKGINDFEETHYPDYKITASNLIITI